MAMGGLAVRAGRGGGFERGRVYREEGEGGRRARSRPCSYGGETN